MLAVNPAAAETDFVIAVAGPMSGRYASFGQAVMQGTADAIKVLNARGGVNGRKLRLVVEDDACDRAKAIAAAKRLIELQVDLVVGHHCPSSSMAAAPAYAGVGVIMISAGTTDPGLTDNRSGPTIFRLAPRSDGEGPAIGAYLARTFKGKRVAVLHDRTVASIQLATAAKKAMNSGGLSEALYSGFIAGEKDYRRLVQDLIRDQIDAVFLGAYPTEAALILDELRARGSTIAVVGSSLMADAEAGHVKLTERARAAVETWSQAVLSSGGGSVAAALQAGTFETSIGTISFDAKGDTKAPLFDIHSLSGGVAAAQ